jgi:hypothetical protein
MEQKSANRGQRSEVRGQRTKDPGEMVFAEFHRAGRGQMTDGREQRAEVKG